MKKNTTKIFIAAIFLTISGTAYAQEGSVGINTSTPAATLDVMASATDLTRIDGLIAPRLKGSELISKNNLYTADQDGAIVYVTEAVSGVTYDKTTNVTSIGYYYFDKTQGTNGRWMKIANPSAAAIYQEPWNEKTTELPATTNTQEIYQMANVGIGTKPDSKLHVAAGNTALRFSNSGSDGILQVSSNATNNWARLGTKGSSLAILTDNTEVGGNAPAIYVENTKNVGVGTSSPTQVLDVNGATRLRGQIYDNNNAAGANGQVLSTNSSGQVVWQNNIAITGVMNYTAPSNAINSANYNTGAYIDLPAGKCVVNATMLLTITGSLLANDGALWIRAGFSTSSSSYISAGNILSGSLVGPSQFGLMNGIVVINNTSGSTQRYYMWRLTSQPNGTATGAEVLDNFAGAWGENQIAATPAN